MIMLFIITGAIGWLLGVWLPWWAIGGVLAFFAIAAFRGAFDGGLESIPPMMAALFLCAFMILVGFASGDITMAQLFGFAKVAFTGN